jgi:hypothetical protein
LNPYGQPAPPDLRGRHDLGEIIGLSLRVYLGNFGAMFAIALTTVPLQMLVAVVPASAGPLAAQAALQAAFIVASMLVGAVANGALIHAVHEAATGTRPEFSRSVDAAIERIGALISSILLMYALVIASLIAAPYFAVRWAFNPQAVMIEGKRNWAALDASSSIVKGQWWRTLGILLVSALVVFAPLIVAGGIAVALPALAGATVEAVALALALPFLMSAQTLLYYDLRARRDALAALPAPDEEPSPDDQ